MKSRTELKYCQEHAKPTDGNITVTLKLGQSEAWKKAMTRRLSGAVTSTAHSDASVPQYIGSVTVYFCVN